METNFLSLSNNYINKLNIPESIRNILESEEFAKENPSYYLEYPALFSQVFDVEEQMVELLCVSGFLYYRSLISMDQLIDEGIDTNSKSSSYIPLVISTCQEETIKILSHIFGIDSEFWKVWNERKSEFLYAMQLEKKMNQNSIPFEISLYYDLAEKKSSMGKIAIDSLHLLSQQTKSAEYERLLEAHRLFSIGLQILDDFQDFRDDYNKGQTNLLIHKLGSRLQENGTYLSDFNIETLHKYIYIYHVATESLDEAKSFFEQSIAKLFPLKIEAGKFHIIVLERIAEVDTIIRQICEYLSIVEKKLELQSVRMEKYQKLLGSTNDTFHSCLYKLLNNIITEANTGFGEMKHVMYLGKQEGFENNQDVHSGDVFQRALLLDVFCDAKQIIDEEILNEVIQNEIEYLKENKLCYGISGWSYFPTVKEIAPDIDDLGQVLQCLIRTDNGEYIHEYLDLTLTTIFSDLYNPDTGGIDTWIVPRQNRTKLQEIQNEFNQSKWGTGPDTEVVANFLFGLTLANLSQYNVQVLKGVQYLLAQQTSEGYWESRWYYGNYYGTYTCLRIFHQLGIIHDGIQKAIDYILVSQNDDGGWSNDSEESNMMGTCFALLSLSLYSTSETVKNAILLGHQYMMKSLREQKYFCSAEAFIIPKVGEPYKSKTMTTAYAVKALISIQEIVNA